MVPCAEGAARMVGPVLIAALIEDAPWCSVRVLFQSAGRNAVLLILLPENFLDI